LPRNGFVGIGITEVRVQETGLREVNQSQVAVLKSGVVQRCSDEATGEEIGFIENRAVALDAIEIHVYQVGTREIAAGEVASDRYHAHHFAAVETAICRVDII